MAEVATKKSINVVSSNKHGEVCSVQSNNGLIDLDNITTNNSQIISLCDDDLLLTNNSKNDMNAEDKSLQELIESELALRISTSNDDEEIEVIEEDDTTKTQPEIKKIILEPRPDPLDINSEFIIAEMDHYNVIEDPSSYQNGHSSPTSKTPEKTESLNIFGDHTEHELECAHDEEAEICTSQPEANITTVTEQTTSNFGQSTENIYEKDTFHLEESGDFGNKESLGVSDEEGYPENALANSSHGDYTMDDVVHEHFQDEVIPAAKPSSNKHHQKEEVSQTKVFDDTVDFIQVESHGPVDEFSEQIGELTKTADLLGTWSNPDSSSDAQQTGQFSDNFDETLQDVETSTQAELGPETSEDHQLNQIQDSVIPVDLLIQIAPTEAQENEEKQDTAEIHPQQSLVETEELVTTLPQESNTLQREQEQASQQEVGSMDSNARDTSIGDKCRQQTMEPVESQQHEDLLLGEDEDDLKANRMSEQEVNSSSNIPNTRNTSSPTIQVSSEEISSTLEFLESERRDVHIDGGKNYREPCEEIEILVEDLSEQKEEKDTDEKEEQEQADDDAPKHEKTVVESSTKSSTTTTSVIGITEKSVSNETVRIFSESKYADQCFFETPKPAQDFESWTTVEDATTARQKAAEETQNVEVTSEWKVTDINHLDELTKADRHQLAPLATPDDETSDVSNQCDLDSEKREEVITTASVVTSSSTSTKTSKTKKKKIEGVASSDASPTQTPRTKKTKKSKKSDPEKENISVCRSFGDLSNMSDGEQNTFGQEDHDMDSQEKSSFNKFDALSKKTVLHVRSVDAGKVQQQLNSVGQNGDPNPNCRSCGKVVFQMEQTKAEGSIWHKNCFRCVQCSKQLNVDSFQSHEGTLYCKPHFKELFQPKPVEESDQPTSDKPDLGLEELSALNVKSRFQVFEKGSLETNDIERSPSQVAVKRSPSILSKLAKFQAKGMDIGVADESLNGIPFEESSESEEEVDENEDEDTEIIKSKHTTRERPMSFSKMDDIKNRWESTSQQGRRESQREARKEEIAGIRSRLFMGKQGKMKEMYQQAVAESERVTKINAAEEIQHAAHTRSIKERFERGEPIATSDDEGDNKPKPEKPDEEVIAAGISKKSRSLFLELDATAAKTGRPVTPVTPKTPADASRRVRDMDSPEREIYRDPGVVRAEDRVDEVVHTDTARKMLSIFRQMEEKATKEDIPDGPKPLKRFTPPPEDKFAKATASESEEEDEEEGEESEGEESGEDRDPNYVRASDKVEDEFLKQAQNAARAKTLRAKFEHWETTDEKVSNHGVAEMEIAQGAGDQSSIESASSLRARFESLGSNSSESPRTPKVKVNRFVEIQTNYMEVCEICQKKVYPLEKVETNNKIFHKQCFRCLQCNCILRMDTFTLNNGKLYCIPHFKQLFITRGNYDEGFGIDPHKNKWASSNSGSTSTLLTPTTPSPITVSNGDL